MPGPEVVTGKPARPRSRWARDGPDALFGLAGNAESFLKRSRVTRAGRWRERAHHFGRLAVAYWRATP